MSSKIITYQDITRKILFIRGQKVMIDNDLAGLYGVTTKVLNQAAKRNLRRFPEDFMFTLSRQEKEEVVTNCDHLRALKFSPNFPRVFTEQGIAMLSTVLNSARAIDVNIAIMRVFVQLREILLAHKELAYKLNDLEGKVGKHDKEIKLIFEAIRQLMAPPPEKPKGKIGFYVEEEDCNDQE